MCYLEPEDDPTPPGELLFILAVVLCFAIPLAIIARLYWLAKGH